MSSRAVSFVLTVLILVASASASMPAQQGSAAPASPAGAVDVITVQGTSLEGNLAGDSPDRTVPVYLAASYATDRDRRYPVLYLLHGFTDSDERWFGRVQHFVNVPRQADAAIASGTREMIIVMPNAYTKFAGSMYSGSVVIGDWERFIARDLVSDIDGRYRTLANVSSRGLAGHSMGGFGVMRIGMTFPDDGMTAEQVRTLEDVAGAGFGVQAQLAMVDRYIGNLRRMKAIAMDAGDRDEPIAATVRTMNAILNGYALAHTFDIYDGDHVNRVAERVEKNVLPFFSANLNFDAPSGGSRR